MISEATTTCSVRLKNVTKRYGSFTAVDDLTLDIRRGELLTLLGPSGCGKTTTLRTIGGLEKPAMGTVEIDGEDVTHLPANLRPVNTVFQSYALFPHLTVFENVAFGLRRARRPSNEIRAKVSERLALLGLESFHKKRPYQLSGGEQQRVALARALVLEPGVLLLDEPFASLDFKLRQRLQLDLKTLQREVGISFVMVTHDQNEAMAMSDRIAVMNQGSIEQVGDPIDVYERPETPFVAAFIGDANFLNGTLARHSSGVAVAEVPGVGEFAAENVSGRVGRPVSIFVRPENLQLEKRGRAAVPDGFNKVDGVVVATVIVGGLDRKVLVRMDNNDGLLESLVRAEAGQSFQAGDEVAVCWPPAKTRIFAGEET